MNSGGSFQLMKKGLHMFWVISMFSRLTAPAISSSMCGIFNETLMMAEIPVEWKAARIVPIPKSTHAKCVEDFCPLSVLL